MIDGTTAAVGDTIEQECIACGRRREHRLGPLQLPVDHPAYADHLIARCSECGLTSAWPRPSEQDLKEAYADVPHVVRRESGLAASLWRSYRDGARLRLLKSVAPEGSTILDVGTGAGLILRVAKGVRGWTLIGTDYSERNVEELRNLGFDARVGMIDDVGLQPKSIDVVWASHVIEHMRDPVGFLESVRSVLKPGGKLVAILPSSRTMRARTATSTWHLVNPPGHLWGFSPATFRSLLTRNGFRIERLFQSIPVCEMLAIAHPEEESDERRNDNDS